MAFSSTRIFNVSPNLIQPIAQDVAKQLSAEGYETQLDGSLGNNVQVSISKGGMFKKVVGMKTALNLMLTDEGDCIKAKTEVGIFGLQAIPTAITMLFWWPMLIPQIVGLVKQSKLDSHVMELIDSAMVQLGTRATLGDVAKNGVFCPNCGVRVSGGKFCAECGSRLE